MSHLTLEQIRSKFIDFFKNNDHKHLPSSSLVPHNDPSLMFVNSGMVQFKDVFTGVEHRDYNRAVTSQKSVRAGGKHNDLDNVGYTARHHTFFEMLGNFSFGNYFKEEAIKYSWDLLVKELGISKEKLYFTVYHNDDESATWWKKITGFSDDRIIRISTSDNFWSMGDLGPCGPCTEIFYDHGDKIPGGLPGTPEEDGDRYIEIWNLVFMQYEQIDKNTKIELAQKSVDTGMGLERISAVVQGKHDNYDTDMFQDLISNAETILKVKAENEALFSYRVIADHLRSASFLIADGVMPSNEGRGYVLRRIMRRAMRHAHQLGAKEPLMYRLLPKLVDHFGHTFPEIKTAEEFVCSILKQEEERFKVTLDKGLKLLENETASMSGNGILKGETAFKLYDTFGFPLDLTEDILKKHDITVDHKGFEKCMNQQKERARSAWSGSGESKTDKIWFDILAKHGSTEFLGYSHNSMEGNVIALIKDNNEVSEISNQDDEFILIANQTPFYGESGGQMGDIGEIISNHCQIQVTDTKKYAGKIHAHKCILKSGLVKTNDSMKFVINEEYRSDLKIHHSATHILHAVLRNVLGRHVTQKGSLVANDKLRFDFSHIQAVSKAELQLIEELVNKIIIANSIVSTDLLSLEKAQEAGAMALFGEKYDSEVRVVSMGGVDNDDNPYSFELCGGTHVTRTGNIGLFKITSESAIAAGIRRIEAVCGTHALKYFMNIENSYEKIIDTLKTNKTEVQSKIESLLVEKKELEKKLSQLQMGQLIMSKEQIDSESIQIKDAKLVYQQFDGVDGKAMRAAAEDMTKNNDNLIITYVATNSGKISIIVACSKNIISNYNAGNIAKHASAIVGGSGGGKPTLAQAGGSDISKLANLKNEIAKFLQD